MEDGHENGSGGLLTCFDCSRGPALPEQAVVTSRAPMMHTETSQLTEDNEDFAGRGRYHQSEVVQGKHFDDDYRSDWDAIGISLPMIYFLLLWVKYRHASFASMMRMF